MLTPRCASRRTDGTRAGAELAVGNQSGQIVGNGRYSGEELASMIATVSYHNRHLCICT
jgi:hypothetical protein